MSTKKILSYLVFSINVMVISSIYIGFLFDYLYPNSRSVKALKDIQITLEHISKEINGSFSLSYPTVRSINTWTYPGAKIILDRCVNEIDFLKVLKKNGIVKSENNINFCKNDIRLTIKPSDINQNLEYCSRLDISIKWIKNHDC